MIGSWDVCTAICIFFKILTYVVTYILYRSVTGQLDPIHRIVINQVKQPCPESVTAIFKNLLSKRRGATLVVDFRVRVSDWSLRLDTSIRPHKFRS